MHVFVVSDSHGSNAAIEAIFDRAKDADVIFHLGDGAADPALAYALPESCTLVSVRGNCDSPGCGAPDFAAPVLERVKLFACHGHRYGVQYDLTRLWLAAREQGAALCLFGHTHRQLLETHDGVTFLNPGAANEGKYAMIEISDGRFYPVLLSLY